eukprot:TRINITY_DN903_c1_g1_i1.p1 TRINITY_DN903_c1_g1~~TRINITY_DN903_c1_g1_i1.p1  ORF type:complete len:209 (+),score=58.79 TRINITY_DN903_c1_g1_i1:34-627(+)
MSLERQLFQLKFTSKQMQRQSKRCEKSEKMNKNKLKQAIEKGNMDGAKIYAENSIREKNQALNYLRLSSRIDAVAARVETAVRMRTITRSMTLIVNNLERASQTMNLEQITIIMDKFEKGFEDLDVQSNYVEKSMNQSTTLSTPQDEVDMLITQVAEINGLELQETLGTTGMTSAQITSNSSQDELADRLAKLRTKS